MPKQRCVVKKLISLTSAARRKDDYIIRNRVWWNTEYGTA